MASCNDRFCSLCDPTSVRAEKWCSECDDFLCLDCSKHHKVSRISKSHFVISINDYEELPSFVSSMKFYCEEHGDKLDAFCPAHNLPCCIRCVLSSHKKCYGVAPLNDLVKNAKSSPQMLEIEYTLNELKTFVERVKSDKETNKKDIKEQQERIRADIRLLREAVNGHIDTLEDNLVRKLNETSETISSDEDQVLNELLKVSKKIQEISHACLELKEKASDMQTFLGIPHLVSEVTSEKKNIEKMLDEGSFNKKCMVLTDKLDFSQTIKSLADIIVDVQISKIKLKVEKEKQAQFIGVLPPTFENKKLKLGKAFHIQASYEGNIVSGCSITEAGDILFSEYNPEPYKDRVVMHNSNGNFRRCIARNDGIGSMYDVVSLGSSNVAVSVDSSVYIVNISTSKSSILKTNDHQSRNLYGITARECNKLAVLGSTGIFASDSLNAPLRMIRSEPIKEWSYIASHNDNLFYTSGDETVQCCNMEGTHLWTFEDTSLLRSPRGIAVDRDGYIYVAGEESENIVALSPDGKFWKDLQRVISPRTLCYCETKHQLLVCNLNNDAYLFDIFPTF